MILFPIYSTYHVQIMVALPIDEEYLQRQLRRVEMECFPKTDAIYARTNIIHRGDIILVGLRDHWLNIGDPMEVLTRIWLDASRTMLFNLTQKSGNYFERNTCEIAINGRKTIVTRYVRINVLHFRLVFITISDKKYIQIPSNDAAWDMFNRLYNVFG